MHILHRRLTSLVCVIHGCAWVKKVDRRGIGKVAYAIIHSVIDVPADCLQFLLTAETHQRPISHSYTEQAGSPWNVDNCPCAIACTFDLRLAKLDWIFAVECWPG